ncbi:MAG TPA: hypothetical protein PKH80_03065 [Methanofastidiosum sp.]|nr:hypothetical protein [Methanofastidiosum sp.]HNU61941.1 hypothetical protein [Methanofastidiosum sp.]
MILKNLRINGIRCFNIEKDILLDEGLTVIYGQNAQGKTSFVEAIEWLLFGKIYKKENAPSKIEYKDVIKNLHSTTKTPFVEGIFTNNGEVIKIRREYISEEESDLYINDILINDNSELFGNIRPIIYQHGLKTFIHTEPKDRYLAFMKLLGIEEIDNFRKLLQTTKTGYNNSKTEDVKKSYYFCGEIEDELNDYYNYIMENDITLVDLCNKINNELRLVEYKLSEADISEFKIQLNIYSENIKKKVFNLDLLSPIINFKEIDMSIFSKKEEVNNVITFLLDKKNVLADAKINVLENGLKIITKSNSSECPLCSEDTINDNKIIEIEKEIQSYLELKTTIKKNNIILSNYIKDWNKYIYETTTQLKNIILDDGVFDLLKNIGIQENILSPIKEKNQSIKNNISKIKLDDLILEDINLETLQNRKEILDCHFNKNIILKNNLISLKTEINRLSLEISNILSLIQNAIISSEEINRINKFISLIKNFDYFKIIKIDMSIEKELTDSLKSFEEFRNETLEVKLNEHKKEIIKWYDLLNPNESIFIEDIESKKGKINFLANLYGTTANAAPNLSECHLNCLGLSIYLSEIINEKNAFSFILIDDPVQSMDEMHTLNFITEIIQMLIAKKYQIFILTHLKKQVSNSIIDSYKDFLPTLMEFFGCNIEGPKIKFIKQDRFEDYISVAEQNCNGDYIQRKSSANMIRQALEAYSKEYYCKISGEELPEGFKNETYSVIEKKLFSRISISPDEKGKLRKINDMCSIGSHDDQKEEPPTYGQLKSSIDILKRLYKKNILKII